MNIIAFDLGSDMAWAFNYGRRGVGTGRALYAGARAKRLGDMARDVANLLNGKNKFDVLVYETPFARGYAATRSLWGIAGVLEAAATNANMAVLDVSVATIKKFATGNGAAPKQAMVAAARRFGYTGNNEHEADAVCLLRYAQHNLERG